MNDVVLSICIPTYNRYTYLDRLLNSIIHQIVDTDLPVEVCITDNASTDATEDLCLKYCQQYSFVKYTRQHFNTGPDNNIVTAYNLASSGFVWIIGDDDYLRNDSLETIVNILASDETIDMVSLGSSPHKEDDIYINKEVVNISCERCKDAASFAAKVGVTFTFISGLIVNKRKIEHYDFEPYMGTYLIQLSWTFRLLRNGHNFVRIDAPIVFAEQDNSGGYRFFEVFGVNLSSITRDILGDSYVGELIRMSAMKHLILSLLEKKNSSGKFERENYITVMDEAFFDLLEYKLFYKWLFRCLPAAKTLVFIDRFIIKKIRQIAGGG